MNDREKGKRRSSSNRSGGGAYLDSGTLYMYAQVQQRGGARVTTFCLYTVITLFFLLPIFFFHQIFKSFRFSLNFIVCS